MFTRHRDGHVGTDARGTQAPPPEPAAGETGDVRLFTAPGLLMSSAIHLTVVLLAGAIVLEHYILQPEDTPTVYGIGASLPYTPVDYIPPPPTNNNPFGASLQETEREIVDAKEVPIVFPGAKPSDKNRSNDHEDYDAMKGQSDKFLTSNPGEAGGFGRLDSKLRALADTRIGLGGDGGGGGRHGGPHGAREDTYVAVFGDPNGIPPSDPVHAVIRALRWLARHQNNDGSWSVTGFESRCGHFGCAGACSPNAFTGSASFDKGVTGLALLAFLGMGVTPSSHEKVAPGQADSPTFGHVVREGLKHVLAAQGPDGLIGAAGDKHVYNHALCALALTEAYGMTALPELKEPAQRAIDWLVRARTPGGGWRYSAGCGDTDSSVTGWAIMALKAAEVADLRLDRAVYDDLRKYYDGVTVSVPADKLWTPPNSRGTGVNQLLVTGYKDPADAGSLVAMAGVNEKYDYTPALTAIMVMSRMFMDHKLTGKAAGAVETLQAYLPQTWDPKAESTWHRADFYFWYYGSYAMYQVTSDDKDSRWTRWNGALRAAVLDTQNSVKTCAGQCREGSWEPVDRWSCEGGRVYATAMGALTLEVYYRYPRVAHK